MTLTTQRYLELPEYAQLIQNAAKAIGITVNLKVRPATSITARRCSANRTGSTATGHHRLRPPRRAQRLPVGAADERRLLELGPFQERRRTTGWWPSYIGALDIGSQRAAAGKIQHLLLDETPLIIAYFYDYLTATRKGVNGVEPTAMSQLYLGGASCRRGEGAAASWA